MSGSSEGTQVRSVTGKTYHLFPLHTGDKIFYRGIHWYGPHSQTLLDVAAGAHEVHYTELLTNAFYEPGDVHNEARGACTLIVREQDYYPPANEWGEICP